MKRMQRTTKKRYMDLYDNPSTMFDGAQVILWPNGYPVIWIKDNTGRTYEIGASRGPHGFALRVHPLGVRAHADISGNLSEGRQLAGFHVRDACHVEICQYDDTESAQAHRRWYAGEAEHPDGNHTPPSGKYLIPPAKPKESFEVAPTGTADAGEAFGGNGR